MAHLSSKYQHDYKDAEYSNPRLNRDREKRQHRWRVFGLGLLIVIIIGLIYLLFFSPIFQIKNVQVIGLEKIKPENIDNLMNEYRAERRWLVLTNNNLLLFNSEELKSRIKQKYFFEKLEIKKKMPATIVIELKEKISAVDWLANNLCYHLDMSGMAIEYCDGASPNMAIKDMLNKGVVVGEPAIDRESLVYIVELAEQFGMLMNERLKLVRIEKTENLLDFMPENGPVVRFNSNLTQTEQILRLNTLISQTDVGKTLGNMKYIDLRFGEKIYYQ